MGIVSMKLRGAFREARREDSSVCGTIRELEATVPTAMGVETSSDEVGGNSKMFSGRRREEAERNGSSSAEDGKYELVPAAAILKSASIASMSIVSQLSD